jgi:hypothetical protein
MFRIFSEFLVIFRIFRHFRISSTNTGLFRISWLCSVESIHGRSSVTIIHFVPKILKRFWKFWKLLKILNRFWTLLKILSRFWSLLKILNRFWTDSENSENCRKLRSSITIAHFISICWQTWPPQTILVSDWPISNNLLLWNCLAKWAELWWKAPIEGSDRPIRNKNRLWRPCLLTDRDEMNNRYWRPSIDAFYTTSLLLANCLAKWTETW